MALLYESELAGRDPNSFAYRIDEVWAGYPVDTYFTDDPADIDEPQAWANSTQYDIRITHDGVTMETKPTPLT